jgi:apolipoprotein N-acyltransferase
MVRATHEGGSVGGAVESSATTNDPHVVALAALFFLPLLTVFFGSVLWLVLAQPDMPFALIGFVVAFLSIGLAIASVGLVFKRARRRASQTKGGVAHPSIKE